MLLLFNIFFFSSRRRHTRSLRDWSSDVCSSDLAERRELEALWQGIAAVHSLTWPGNVALLAGARIYVGPDTSVTHLAAAAGCPTVARSEERRVGKECRAGGRPSH